MIAELCKIAVVDKSRTTPYHAMGNGMVERFNQTLLKILGTLHYEEKTDWKAHVSTLVHTYNATHHESIGHTPFYLMFGRHPRLAIDAFLGLGENKKALQTVMPNVCVNDLPLLTKQAPSKRQRALKGINATMM